jgi:bacterioferritin B
VTPGRVTLPQLAAAAPVDRTRLTADPYTAMLIASEINKAFNVQVGNEMHASVQYVQIATYFDGEGLPVLAAHFHQQALEEREHAMRFVKYMVDTGGSVEIPAIPAPKSSFRSAEEAVQLSLDWELTVTDQINKLMDLAIEKNDHLARNLLEWFVNEQLEEVSSMDQLLRLVKRAGESGLIFVENYLARGKAPSDIPNAISVGD